VENDGRYRQGDLSTKTAPDRRSLRRAFLLGNSFEFLLAFAAVLTAIGFLTDPASVRASAVADAGGWIVIVWALLYGAGGVFIFVGLWRPFPSVELAGLSMFGSATLIDSVALFAERGGAGYRVALTYLAVACASAARARMIWLLTRRT
jgi:hypothetical protein